MCGTGSGEREGILHLKRRSFVLLHSTHAGGYRMLFRKLKKRRVQLVQRPLVAPTAQNEWWAMDFVHDAFVDGRKFRCLVVEDVYS